MTDWVKLVDDTKTRCLGPAKQTTIHTFGPDHHILKLLQQFCKFGNSGKKLKMMSNFTAARVHLSHMLEVCFNSQGLRQHLTIRREIPTFLNQ